MFRSEICFFALLTSFSLLKAQIFLLKDDALIEVEFCASKAAQTFTYLAGPSETLTTLADELQIYPSAAESIPIVHSPPTNLTYFKFVSSLSGVFPLYKITYPVGMIIVTMTLVIYSDVSTWMPQYQLKFGEHVKISNVFQTDNVITVGTTNLAQFLYIFPYYTNETSAKPMEFSREGGMSFAMDYAAFSNLTAYFYNCSSTCKACNNTNITFCLDCYANAELLPNNTCQCKSHFYWVQNPFPCDSDDVTNCFYCDNCHPKCAECFGPDWTQCTSCPDGTFLYENSCVEQCPLLYFFPALPSRNRTCVSECPPNTFFIAENGTCVEECRDFAEFFFRFLTGNQCLSECPPDAYVIPELGLCFIDDCATYLSNSLKVEAESLVCYDECPQNASFLIEELKLCVEKCEDYAEFGFSYGKQCVSQCPNGTFLVRDGALCVDHCENTTNFTNLLTNECVDSCESPSFLIETLRLCVENCSDYAEFGLFFGNQCLARCPEGNAYFLQGNECKLCDVSCESCEILATNCTACAENYYFFAGSAGKTCVLDCPAGYFKQNSTKTCEISTNNSDNTTENTSESANTTLNTSESVENTTLNTSESAENAKNSNEIPVDISLNNTEDCLRFTFSVNNSASPLFSALETQPQSAISFVFSTINVSFQLYSLNNSRDFSVLFEVLSPFSHTNYPFTLLINETFVDLFNENSTFSYVLLRKQLQSSLNLSRYCEKAEYFDENSGKCLAKASIDFVLFYKNSQYPLYLSFSSGSQPLNYTSFPWFFEQISNFSQIIIENLVFSQDFRYFLEVDAENSLLKLTLQLNSSLISGNSLTFSLYENFSASNFANFSLVRLNRSISLLDFYAISEETRALINQTAEIMDQAATISSGLTFLSAFLGVMNAMSLKVLIIVDLLRFFKYINIKYPINMLELFESGLNLGQTLNTFDFEVSEDDPQPLAKFKEYEVSSYFLNNANISLLQFLVTYLLGLFLVVLSKKSGFFASAMELNWLQIKEKCSFALFLKGFFNVLFKLIVWNFIIAQFLSSFNENMLYCLINFYWPPLFSQAGKLNFIVATAYFFLLICSLLFIYWKISSLRRIRRIPLNSVFPQHFQRNSDEESGKKSKNESLLVENLDNPEIPKEKPHNHWDFSDFFDMNSPNLPQFSRFSAQFSDKRGFPIVPWEKIKDLLDELHEKGKFSVSLLKSAEIRDVPTASSQKKPNFLLKLPRKSEISFEETTARTRKESNSAAESPNLQPIPAKTAAFDRESREKCLKNRYFILFKGLKSEKVQHAYFLLFELLRQATIAFLLVILWDEPLIAILMVSSLNFLFLLGVCFVRPYKETKDWLFGIFSDLGLNLAGFVCCYLAFMDKNRDFDAEKRMTLGWIFVITNCVLIIFMLLVYCWQLLRFLWMFARIARNFYRKRRKNSENKREIAGNEKKIEKKQRKTINDKIKDTLELNNLFMS